MKQFQDILQALIDRWNSLNPAQQQHIVQTIFMVGQWTLFGGIALKVIGETVRGIGEIVLLGGKLIGVVSSVIGGFVSLLSLNPALLGIYISIGLIVAAMIKWKDFGDYVADTLQKIGDVVGIIVRTMIAGYDAITGHLDKAKEQMAKIKADWDDLTRFQGGQHGTFAQAFDNIKISIGGAIDGIHNFKNGFTEVLTLIKGGTTSSTGGSAGRLRTNDFFQGFSKGLEDARQSLGNFFSWGSKAATDMTAAMKSSFSSFFNDAFHGELKKGRDYFAEFGNSILKIFTDVLSQMVTKWIEAGISNMFMNVGMSLGGLGGIGSAGAHAAAAGAGTTFSAGGSFSNVLRFHSGGPIQRAHDGLGVDEVPIIAQTGEGILSRTGMANLAALNKGGMKGGGVHITIAPVIQAWDASDVMRNRKSIIDIIGQDIMNNGTLRQIMKDGVR